MKTMVFLLALLSCRSGAWADAAISRALARSESSKSVFRKPVPGFTGPGAKADFFVTDSTPASDGNPVDVYGVVSASGRPPVFLSVYPYDGGRAEISDAFPASSGARLFVICRWRQVHRGLGTDGYFYRVHAYRDSAVIDPDGYLSAVPDDSLAAKFGAGFDGMMEGEKSVFAFKTAEKIRAWLDGPRLPPSEAECHRKTLKSYQAKALDVGCAVTFANGPGLTEAEITPGNAALYNDLGFLLGEGSRFKESVRVLEKVVASVPGRTVAYLNLADSYWGLSDSLRARPMYLKYRDLMKSEGKATRIPKRVLVRAKQGG